MAKDTNLAKKFFVWLKIPIFEALKRWVIWWCRTRFLRHGCHNLIVWELDLAALDVAPSIRLSVAHFMFGPGTAVARGFK